MPGMQSIEGLASNLNTTAIVDAIMKAEHRPVDLIAARQTEATNQLTTYNSISALMVALGSSVAALNRATNFDAATLSVSDDKMVTAQTTGKVAVGTYSLSIDALATNHQLASQGYADPAATLLGTGTVQIAVGKASPTTLTLGSSNNTLNDLKDAINAANMGITASIINDGSSANPYRLLLSANTTGAENTISLTSNLTGGVAPNVATPSFDAVENVGAPQGTSAKTLGPTAAYTGSQNKTYTFTVAGSGTQTVGSGPITVNWTDGVNSGSISVTTAGGEVALTGAGADGLTLTLGAGTLVAGDQFRVQTFSPVLQKAADARVSLGSTSSGGSPIVISSATNQLDNLIGGISLKLKAVTITPVIITANIDQEAIKASITGVIDKYNEVMRAIDKQFSYNADTQQAGSLLGDQFLLSLQANLRAQVSGAIDGLPKSLNMLGAIGVRPGNSGLLALVDSSALSSKLTSDPNGVRNLFVDSGTSSNPLISFLSAGTKTAESRTGYTFQITQAATQMMLDGAAITDPAASPLTLTTSNNTLRLTVDGVRSSEIALAAKTYASSAELVSEIQQKIKADALIGSRGVSVEWIGDGTTGHLRFTSGSYGASSSVSVDNTVTNSAFNNLGFVSGGFATAGSNVAGTINGRPATGTGRVLTSDKNSGDTAGLAVDVRMTAADVIADGTGTLTYRRGFASRLGRTLDAMTRSTDGSIAGRTKGIQAQIDDLKTQIADQEKRLAVRREKLFQRFTALEQALSQFQAQGAFLSQQLGQIAANTRTITSQ